MIKMLNQEMLFRLISAQVLIEAIFFISFICNNRNPSITDNNAVYMTASVAYVGQGQYQKVRSPVGEKSEPTE